MPDSKLMADYIKSNDCIGYFIKDEIKTYDLAEIKLIEEMPVNPIGMIYPKRTINKVAKNFIDIVLDNKN